MQNREQAVAQREKSLADSQDLAIFVLWPKRNRQPRLHSAGFPPGFVIPSCRAANGIPVLSNVPASAPCMTQRRRFLFTILQFGLIVLP